MLPLVTAVALGYAVFARFKAAQIGRAVGAAFPCCFLLALMMPIDSRPDVCTALLAPAAAAAVWASGSLCRRFRGASCLQLVIPIAGCTAEELQEADGDARASAKRRLSDDGVGASGAPPPLASAWALEAERAAWRVPPKYSTHTCVGQKFYDNWHT